jgi:hypothetical protein
MSHPTMRFGDVVVVFEGARRIAWSAGEPAGVWPHGLQARAILRRIAVREPVLVVVAEPEAVVGDVRVPAFDWLPEEDRLRGLLFLQESFQRARELPDGLLPPVALEPTDAALRFLHVLRPWPQLEQDLPQIADLAFGARLRMVA